VFASYALPFIIVTNTSHLHCCPVYLTCLHARSFVLHPDILLHAPHIRNVHLHIYPSLSPRKNIPIMCGITCILSLSSQHRHHPNGQPNGTTSTSKNEGREDLARELNASMDQIKHRGPDARGKWISDDCRVGTLASPHSPKCCPPFPR